MNCCAALDSRLAFRWLVIKLMKQAQLHNQQQLKTKTGDILKGSFGTSRFGLTAVPPCWQGSDTRIHVLGQQSPRRSPSHIVQFCNLLAVKGFRWQICDKHFFPFFRQWYFHHPQGNMSEFFHPTTDIRSLIMPDPCFIKTDVHPCIRS